MTTVSKDFLLCMMGFLRFHRKFSKSKGLVVDSTVMTCFKGR